MAMPLRFIIVALPISKGLKFDLKRVVAYEIYELLPSDEVAMRC